jgi:threonine dehydrogenase-like Zn-dependent dehydrogenase
MSGVETTAFLLEQDLTMRVGSRELPALAPDEALVRVRWAGLCGSDLHVMRTGAWVREWPATLGHEIYGTVERAPESSALRPGQAVVADSRVTCGRCPSCVNGRPDDCMRVEFVGEARPGGFAEFCALPARMLHPVPDALQGASAVLSEPLAVVIHALATLRSEPRRVLIIGHGPIGALINIELRRRAEAVTIDVAEPAELRASLARALGSHAATSTLELEGGSYDTVIDAAGYSGSLADAVRACAPRGQVLIVSLSERPVSLRPDDLVERSLCLLGSNAFAGELPEASELLAAERWRYEPVITDAISLSELPDVARAQLRSPESVKVVISP